MNRLPTPDHDDICVCMLETGGETFVIAFHADDREDALATAARWHFLGLLDEQQVTSLENAIESA